MFNHYLCLLVLIVISVFNIKSGHSKVINEDTNIPNNAGPNSGRTIFLDFARRRCPLCDSSVYGYCSDKLFHDSCCCNNPNNPYYPLPRECQFADCGFLHANSCQEHKLITQCCCIGHMDPLPRECQFADCSFLHANSCQQHKLIKACCCLGHMNALQ